MPTTSESLAETQPMSRNRRPTPEEILERTEKLYADTPLEDVFLVDSIHSKQDVQIYKLSQIPFPVVAHAFAAGQFEAEINDELLIKEDILLRIIYENQVVHVRLDAEQVACLRKLTYSYYKNPVAHLADTLVFPIVIKQERLKAKIDTLVHPGKYSERRAKWEIAQQESFLNDYSRVLLIDSKTGESVNPNSIPFRSFAEAVRRFSVSAIPGSRRGFADTETMQFTVVHGRRTYQLIIPSWTYPELRRLAFRFFRDPIGAKLDKIVKPIGNTIVRLTHNTKQVISPRSRYWASKDADQRNRKNLKTPNHLVDLETVFLDEPTSKMPSEILKQFLLKLKNIEVTTKAFGVTLNQRSINKLEAQRLAAETTVESSKKPVLSKDEEEEYRAFETTHKSGSKDAGSIVRFEFYRQLSDVLMDRNSYSREQLYQKIKKIIAANFPDLAESFEHKTKYSHRFNVFNLIENNSTNSGNSMILSVCQKKNELLLSGLFQDTNTLPSFEISLDLTDDWIARYLFNRVNQGSLTELLTVIEKSLKLSFWESNYDFSHDDLASPVEDIKKTLRILAVLRGELSRKQTFVILGEKREYEKTEKGDFEYTKVIDPNIVSISN